MAQKTVISNNSDLHIRQPLVWLAIVSFLVYAPSFFYGITELDDFVLIFKSDQYNKHLYSLISAFTRGVFAIPTGHYYRPVFLDSMILNYQLCGKNIAGYHIANVGFHIIAVALLYKLFLKLELKQLHAFILCLLFAVHPVLSQAVAWIPGRNDTLLAIFTFSFFIYTINYTKAGKLKYLMLSVFFLLLAFFTKETAVFAPVVAFILIVIALKKKWSAKVNIIQYALWACCGLTWWILRSIANPKGITTEPGIMIKEFVYRLPVILQYMGKLVFPFNLSVYPSIKYTTCLYGIVSVLILALTLYLQKKRSWRIILCGSGFFLVFLLPVLILPSAMSMRTFEQRLYLPMAGFLLILEQTTLFNNRLKDKQLLSCYISVACLLAGLNIRHQTSFKDPIAFWSQASVSAPDDAHPLLVLAMREKDPTKSYLLFSKAYKLDPNEKLLNFCRGVKLQSEDSIPASEPYLMAERASSGYYECDYYLARVAVKKKDIPAAITYLQSYITQKPGNQFHTMNKFLEDPVWQNPVTARKQAMYTCHPAFALDILNSIGL